MTVSDLFIKCPLAAKILQPEAEEDGESFAQCFSRQWRGSGSRLGGAAQLEGASDQWGDWGVRVKASNVLSDGPGLEAYAKTI